jgi:hypothetical protein
VLTLVCACLASGWYLSERGRKTIESHVEEQTKASEYDKKYLETLDVNKLADELNIRFDQLRPANK